MRKTLSASSILSLLVLSGSITVHGSPEYGPSSLSEQGTDENSKTCTRHEDGSEECEYTQRDPLPTLKHIKDDSKVNDRIKIVLPGGRSIHRVKLSSKPVVYEYKNFLTPEECDHLIESAKEAGMKSGFTERAEANFRIFDINKDFKLDIDEMRTTLENGFDIYFLPEHVTQMYRELNMDKNGDGYISKEELGGTADLERIRDYLKKISKAQPWLKGRYSDHAFLTPDTITDPVILKVIHRVQNITQAPWPLMEKSDIQIVRYPTRGHYNLHLDSSRRSTLPCCHRFNGPRQCRSCRCITVLFYLNDVEEGGETSFPLSGDENFNEQEFRLSFAMNLHAKCPRHKLHVKPEKGKAVFWYNHAEPTTKGEYIGPIDQFTHHGSCPVTKGVKWLANFWIKFTDDREWDFEPLSPLGRNPPLG